MSTTWIKTAWVVEHGDPGGPWLIASYDDITFDNWGEEPEFYTDEVKKYRQDPRNEVRELVIQIPTEAINNLFKVPTVAATVAE